MYMAGDSKDLSGASHEKNKNDTHVVGGFFSDEL